MNMVVIIVEVCGNSPTDTDTANAREIPGDGNKNSENCKSGDNPGAEPCLDTYGALTRTQQE